MLILSCHRHRTNTHKWEDTSKPNWNLSLLSKFSNCLFAIWVIIIFYSLRYRQAEAVGHRFNHCNVSHVGKQTQTHLHKHTQRTASLYRNSIFRFSYRLRLIETMRKVGPSGTKRSSRNRFHCDVKWISYILLGVDALYTCVCVCVRLTNGRCGISQQHFRQFVCVFWSFRQEHVRIYRIRIQPQIIVVVLFSDSVRQMAKIIYFFPLLSPSRTIFLLFFPRPTKMFGCVCPLVIFIIFIWIESQAKVDEWRFIFLFFAVSIVLRSLLTVDSHFIQRVLCFICAFVFVGSSHLFRV